MSLGALVELRLPHGVLKKPLKPHATYSLVRAYLYLCVSLHICASLHIYASCPYGALVEVLLPYPEILYSEWPVGIDPTPCIWGGS